jgi:hypothetical protein
VKLDTSKGYYYLGLVLSVDEDSITLEDKNKRLVTLKIVDVVNVREVLN